MTQDNRFDEDLISKRSNQVLNSEWLFWQSLLKFLIKEARCNNPSYIFIAFPMKKRQTLYDIV